MDLRITYQTSFLRAQSNMRAQTDQLARYQQQAATGKRILEASDDPIGILKVLSSKAQDKRLEAYLGNIRDARSELNVSVSALTQSTDILAKAKQVAVEGAHPVNDRTTYEALAQEIDSLLNRMVDVANTRHQDRYIFSGTATNTVPFDADTAGRPHAVTYQGASEPAQVAVSQQQRVPTSYPGNTIFQQRDRGATLFTGATGAAAGTGTDSATGVGTLQVRHTATTFAVGSGVQPGSGSVAGDTILGPLGANRLTIVDTSGTGASGTIALNGGPAVAFSSSNTNLRITGSQGEVVFLDTTAITPGFNGTVDIQSDGSLSVDGGASSVAIDFSGNQVVTNSVTGEVTNVNSSAIRQAGNEALEYTGTADAFQVLIALRDDLRNTRQLSDGDQATAISNRIGDLDRVRNSILQVVGQQSADLQNLDGMESRAQDVQLETRKLLGETEAADLADVILNIQAQSNLLQLTLASSTKVLDQSLLDFIR